MAKKSQISVNNAGGIFFFVLTAALAYSGIALASDAVEYTISYGGAVFFTFCTVINGKWYTLKEAGIQHRFFGICYRFTPWSEIKDVMRVYQQTGERYAPLTLMFTTKRGNVYRPDESGYVPKAQRKAFYKEWLCGRVFMVPYPLKKGTQRFLAIVEKYYGPLDYDFVAEKEKLHPKRKEWWKE